VPPLDAARLAKLAEETHYKPGGLESEYICASALRTLQTRVHASLWGSTALNLCWIPAPRLLRRLEVANAGQNPGETEIRIDRNGADPVRVGLADRSIQPLFGLVDRDVITPFDELNTTFRTCQAEEIIAQIALDLVREGGILLAYDLSAARQVAFDVEAVRRCLIVYLLAHGLPPTPAKLRERLNSLTDPDIERELDPLLADRVPMVMEVQFRAWNLAAIFFEHREAERAFLEGARVGKGDPGLLFPGREDLIDHPLTKLALERAPGLL
jgi:hypothetical protein